MNCMTDFILKHDGEVFFHDNDLNPPKGHHAGTKYHIRCSECGDYIALINGGYVRRGRERAYFHESCLQQRSYHNCTKSFERAGFIETTTIDDETLRAVQNAGNVTYKGLMPKGF